MDIMQSLIIPLCAICVGFILRVAGESNPAPNTDEQLWYEEIYERQKHEFVDPLGYEEDQTDSDLISFEELYVRQFQEFANPLGYEEDLVDVKNDGESKTKPNDKDRYHENNELRRRRSAAGSDPFAAIAAISGGSVIHTDKDNISSALGVLSSATLPSAVLITRWAVVLHSRWSGTVHVDTSVFNLEIDVQTSCCTPKLTIVDPKGRTVNPADINVTVTTNTSTLYRIRIANPLVGVWSLNIEDTERQTYAISVLGSSPVSFDASQVDVHGNPVTGQPVTDSNSTFMKIEPQGRDMVSNWTYFIVKAVNGTRIEKIPIGMARGSRTLRWYIVPVVWPNMDVYIAVQGLDKNGYMFTREQEPLVMPEGVRLTLDNPEKEYITKCNSSQVLQYTVKNVGPPANFTAMVLIDTSSFTATITPSTFKLDNILPIHLKCEITLKMQMYHDTVANVNVQIISSDGTTQYVQHNLITKDLDCRNNTQQSTQSIQSSREQHSTPFTYSSSTTMTSSLIFVTFSSLLSSIQRG